MFIIISILALLALCISKLRKHPVDKLPGPPALPFVGNMLTFAVARDEMFNKFNSFARDYWPLYRTWQLNTPVIHPLLPQHVEKVLASSKNTCKSRDYRFIESWLGTGIFTSNGAKWQSRRKLLTPSFHFKILEQFVPTFNTNAAILVEKLTQLSAGNQDQQQQPINIQPLITLCALDIICETAMGRSINAQQSDSQNGDYISSVHKIMDLIVYRITRPWLYPDCIFRVTPSGKEFQRCLHTLQSFTKSVISEKRKERCENTTLEIKVMQNEQQNEQEFTGNEKKKQQLVFLDLLLALSECDAGLSDQDICEEVDTFMFGGHDTTSNTMSWALFYLGCNPEIQEQCWEEINGIFDGEERSVVHSDFGNLKLLERVIKETLRLRPPAYMIFRTLDQDLILDDVTYPPGTKVNIHIYNIHQNPEIFPDPEKFDPDRFLPENANGRHPFAYIPFSAGSRNCLGQKFAMPEMKVVLATLIRRFRFVSEDPVKHSQCMPDMILRPKHGIFLRIIPRSFS